MDVSSSEKKKTKPEKPSADDVKQLAMLYCMGNNALFTARKMPTMRIDMQEAMVIASPLHDVMALWGVSLTGINNPYLSLVAACIGVYGGKVAATIAAERAKRAMAQEQAEAMASSAGLYPAPEPPGKFTYAS